MPYAGHTWAVGCHSSLAVPQQSSASVVCRVSAASGQSYHLGWYFWGIL